MFFNLPAHFHINHLHFTELALYPTLWSHFVMQTESQISSSEHHLYAQGWHSFQSFPHCLWVSQQPRATRNIKAGWILQPVQYIK